MPLRRRVDQPGRVREEEAATMEERKRGGLKGAEEAATKQHAHLNTYSSATPCCVPPPVPFFLSRPPSHHTDCLALTPSPFVAGTIKGAEDGL